MNRLSSDERKADILTAAVELANEKGLVGLSLSDIAERCVAETSVRLARSHFSLKELRAAVATDDRADKQVRDDAVALGIS